MTEQDFGQTVAEYLLENNVLIADVMNGATGIATYSFFRIGSSWSNLEEIAQIQFDEKKHTLLPTDAEEMERGLKVPGFLTNVTTPFCRLLLSEDGNFIDGPGFEPIQKALDTLYTR